MGRAKANRSLRRFASGYPLVLWLNAMINRVADHVDEGIAQLLNHIPIQLGLFTFKEELNLLTSAGCEIAHQTSHLLEGTPD